jgi:hypothetical protein
MLSSLQFSCIPLLPHAIFIFNIHVIKILQVNIQSIDLSFSLKIGVDNLFSMQLGNLN